MATTQNSSCDSQAACQTVIPPAHDMHTLPTQVLSEIVRQYGTPTYAYDTARIRKQVEKLRSYLPPAIDMLYSLKANASLGICQVLANCGLGADVASAGEIMLAEAAGFPSSHIFLTGPDKSASVLAGLKKHPEMIVSLDSVSELRLFAEEDLPHRVLLRLRPGYSSYATCSAGPDSRFGLTMDDLPACRPFLSNINVAGFHVFSGSQVLAVDGVIDHLRSAVEQSFRAADALGVSVEIIDIGGGFGIPYGHEEQELDLAAIGEVSDALVSRAAPARLVMELGRYFVAQAGWYLTTVLAEQTHRGHNAVVVDGGSHQRVDLCGVGFRKKVAPIALHTHSTSTLVPTDVLGCLSLPADVLVEGAMVPPLSRGDVLAFPNAGAYGLHAAPCLFHAHPPPAEVAFDGDRIELFRERQPIESVLEGQNLSRIRETVSVNPS